MSSDGQDVDRQALLCALVLAPATYARNRFFGLFTQSSARRTRSRASLIRTIVRHLASERNGAEVRDVALLENGGVALRYALPQLAFERTSMLDRLEIALVRFALSRRTPSESDRLPATMRVTDEDRHVVEGALAKLGRRLDFPPQSDAGTDFHAPTTTGES